MHFISLFEEENPFAVFILASCGGDMYAATTGASDRGEQGRIGLPGGKVDPGESPISAVKREAAEEGWEITEVNPKPILKKLVDGKMVWWFRGGSATKLTSYKELGRITPIEATFNAIKQSGYGNEDLTEGTLLSESDDGRYYISTGSQQKYYTLRYTFQEPTYERDFSGNASRSGSIRRDYHVRNLSTNRDDAIAKAREITGKTLTADFDVGTITRRNLEDIDWSIFQAGKYSGMSIHEVSLRDKDYLVWVCENLGENSRYARTVELAKALVQHELDQRQGDRDAKEGERQERIAAAEELAKRLDREYPTYAQTGYKQWEYAGDARNAFIDGIVDSLRNGQAISQKAADIAIEKLVKVETGARKNSKAYYKAYDDIYDLFEPFIREGQHIGSN